MRVPPYSREAEIGVIGSILLDHTRLDRDLNLQPDDFYDHKNKILWQVFNQMRAEGKNLDVISIKEELQTNDLLSQVGGENYLLDCQDSTIVPSSSGHYASIVREKSQLRKEIGIISDGLETAYKGESCVSDVMSNLAAISIDEQDDKTLYEHAKKYIKDCKDGNVGHFNWFCPAWDMKLGRMGSELAIWHASRSTGKTALMLQTIVQAHIKQQRVPLASIEMLRKELAPRLLAHIGNMNTFWMRSRGHITRDEEERANKAAEDLRVLDLCVRDKGMTIDDIRSWAIIEHRKGADAIFIDNLLSISDGGKQYQSKTIMYDDFIRKFRDLRDILKIPIIILAHPNQDGNVAWSKDVENFADQILFLQEVPYDGVSTRCGRVEQMDTKGENKHIIANFQKNRQGISPIASLEFSGRTQTFEHIRWEDEN